MPCSGAPIFLEDAGEGGGSCFERRNVADDSLRDEVWRRRSELAKKADNDEPADELE